MAKKAPQKKPPAKKSPGRPRKPDGTATVSYSTRFDERQRELVERAAKIKGWSPAYLIREATVRRAIGIVNSEGEQTSRLRRLAWKVVDQIRVPGPDPREDMEAFLQWEYGEYTPSRTQPDEGSLKQIRAALETCGTAFVEMILEQWRAMGRESHEYKAEVTPDDVLGMDTSD